MNPEDLKAMTYQELEVYKILEKWGLVPCLCDSDLKEIIKEIIESQRGYF